MIDTYSDEQPLNGLRIRRNQQAHRKPKQNEKELEKEKTIMKTSIKRRIISIAAAAVMTLSTAAVSMASASAATVNETAVSAYNQGIKINVVVSSEWKQHSAAIGAYFYNCVNGQSTWANVRSSGYMGSSVTVNGDYTHVIFVRFPVHTEFTWANAWNKTADLRISDLNGRYVIQGWEQDANA